MSAEAFFEKANNLFVNENFDEALDSYNKAIDADPNKVDYYVNRAACHVKLNLFTDAITDANTALKLQPNNANAYLRKGMALFSLDEFEAAKQAFEKGQSLDSSNTSFKTWIRKCDAELHVEDTVTTTTTTVTPPSAIPTPLPTPISTPMQTTPTPIQTTPDPIPPKPQVAPEKKMRYEWYQNITHVTVTLFVKNAKKEHCNINIQPKFLDVSINLGSGSEFDLDLDLCDSIIPEQSSIQYLSTKLEIKLRKANESKWESLEAPVGTTKIATRKWDDTSGVDKHTYPSSNPKGRVNWDKVAQDEIKKYGDDKLEGDAALNKVFQDIYSNGSEDQKRAMMKSFVESGGTVLSTNWDEVGKSYVKGSPPSGLEMHDWKEIYQ